MAAHLDKKALGAMMTRLAAAGLGLGGLAGAWAQGVVEPTPAAAPAEPAAVLPLYEIEARRYEDALARGDAKAAELHAYGAWRSAESELGDNRRTAEYALSYGREVVLTDATLALGPLRRAEELAGAGYALSSRPLLALYLAYAEYSAAGEGERDIATLREALYAAEGDPRKRAADDIVMWMEVARADLADEQFEEANYAAGKVESAVIVFAPDNEKSLAEALFIRGVSSIAPEKRTLEDAQNAIEYFQNGERLFPPQQSVETFDPVLASLIGWNTAASAVIRKMSDDPSVLALLRNDHGPLFESDVGKPESCGVDWDNRPAPKFPQSALQKETFGAVVAVFDIADDLSVQNPRILTAAPSDAFDDAVLKAMRSWRVKQPPLDHPGCRTNITTQFSFVVDE